jgi:hypothetical protein
MVMIALIILAIVAFLVIGLAFKLIKVAIIVALVIGAVAVVRGVTGNKRLK